MSDETTASQTLYERIGGEAAVNATVDLFAQKALSDYRLNRYFNNKDLDLVLARLKAFFAMAFGGPNNYHRTIDDIRETHIKMVKMGLSDFHFDIAMGHIGATLQELKVPAGLIAEAAAIAESMRVHILVR